jgi:glucose dehydrogenase
MKKYFAKMVGFVKFDRSYTGHVLFILVGILLVIGTLMKLVGIFFIDSDWYWCLAGFGLVIEGILSLIKQKEFNKKYKVVEITEVKE